MERDDKLSTEELAAAGEREASVASELRDTVDTPTEERSEQQAPVARTSEGAATAPAAAVASGAAATADEQTPTNATEPRTGGEPLLAEDELGRFRAQWEQIQVGFVDEPRGAVEQADSLVAELMQRLASSFSDERSRLEGQWDRGDEVSTEDLRVALTRYRSFFERLLSA
jgi:hypothetical protein